MRKNLKDAVLASLLSAAVLIPSSAFAVTIDLTGDTWDVSGVDQSGFTWNDSTLVFTTQTPGGASSDDAVEGYFDWVGSGGQSGREEFTGTFFNDLTLGLSGFNLIGPVGIVLGDYFAEVSTDGNSIVNGNWTGAGIPSDDWSAVRLGSDPDPDPVPVPAPAPLVLIALGLLGLGYQQRRKAVSV